MRAFLSDQLSEEGDESKIPVQQPSADISNGLRVISTRKLAIGTKQDKGRYKCVLTKILTGCGIWTFSKVLSDLFYGNTAFEVCYCT